MDEAEAVILPEDYDDFAESFTRDNVLELTKNGKVYMYSYRLKIANGAIKVTLRAGMVNENGKSQLIVGVCEADQ